MLNWLKKAVDSGFMQRRVAYYTVLGLTIYYVIETWNFIMISGSLGYTGMETGAILAAVWAPMATLQGYVFTKHKDHERHHIKKT